MHPRSERPVRPLLRTPRCDSNASPPNCAGRDHGAERAHRHAPHAPYTPAPRHKGTLAGLKQPVDPAFNLPDALQQLLPGNLAHLPVVNASQMDTIYESRAEALLAIDEMIGHLLDEVSALGVEDNTYFFFTCDSACSAAQHQRNSPRS